MLYNWIDSTFHIFSSFIFLFSHFLFKKVFLLTTGVLNMIIFIVLTDQVHIHIFNFIISFFFSSSWTGICRRMRLNFKFFPSPTTILYFYDHNYPCELKKKDFLISSKIHLLRQTFPPLTHSFVAVRLSSVDLLHGIRSFTRSRIGITVRPFVGYIHQQKCIQRNRKEYRFVYSRYWFNEYFLKN